MTNATFHNFDDKPFTGYWDGKPKTFKPGERVYMQAYLAEHFAKHLANRWLIEHGKEVYTSPKNPGQVPQFMEIFKKAYIPDAAEATDETEVDVTPQPSMDIVVEQPKAIDQGPAAALDAENAAPAGEPLVITPPGDDDGDEAAFAPGT